MQKNILSGDTYIAMNTITITGPDSRQQKSNAFCIILDNNRIYIFCKS